MTAYAVASRDTGIDWPVSLFRARLIRDLCLICHLGVSLFLDWRLLVEPFDTVKLMVDVGGPALSRRERLSMAEELKALIDGYDDEGNELPNAAWLIAATRWYCQLDIPIEVRSRREPRGVAHHF